ncbi:hypothetical protein ACMFMF_001262 [Clarireedia jacksonii]
MSRFSPVLPGPVGLNDTFAVTKPTLFIMSHKGQRVGYCPDMHEKIKELRGEASPAFQKLLLTVRGQRFSTSLSLPISIPKAHISFLLPQLQRLPHISNRGWWLVAGGWWLVAYTFERGKICIEVNKFNAGHSCH